jgi:AraC family ethanolamine operon transcriptional activator
MALLKTMRLNAVRQALRTAAPGTGVMDVASRWEFQHAGWFSQDYKRQFGESPSETLRNRGRAR